jgi:chemotaxis family two-component system sensor histidine kinase/response regulator PixL
MSLNPDIRDQAYQFFIEEAQELLQVLEDGLLGLREDCSTSKVHELMRAAHSIKGGAASVELDTIKHLAHRLEDFFKALYSDSVEFDSELENLLLQAYDCLRNPLNKQMTTGSFDEEQALLMAEPIFSSLEVRLADALKEGDSYIPSATDLGVDIVSSVFEVDVTEALERLSTIASNPEAYEVAGELRAQLDVFSGFGELFNLPGFNEIIQTAQTALDTSSHRTLEILELTIADCTVAKNAILAGDRQRGGEVSQALINLAQNSAPGDRAVSETETFDDVFGETVNNIWSTASQIESETSQREINNSNLFFDDIFSSVADDTQGDYFNSETIATSSEDIDDVFGMIPDTSSFDGDSSDNFPQPENIETAVESIHEIFHRLPTVDNLPDLLSSVTSPTEPKLSKPKSVKKTQIQEESKSAANLSVRVDLERLERMNNAIGELIINRNSLALQNQQLQDSVGELVSKFFRFRDVTKKLRELSDKMLIESESGNNSQETSTAIEGEFDSLEMDSYSLLYSSLQSVLEEIVQLEESVEDIVIFAKQSNRTIDIQRQMLGQMRDELMWVRMLPLEQILQRLPRTLRDLSNKYNKPVNLKLVGTGVLVDKAVLEKLYDPLLHLLRNAFDHGIETPEIRAQKGKPEEGLIEIRAYYQGNQTVIEVQDDGKGLDLETIAKKAIKNGLISAKEATEASKEELFALIFEPGFSTASKVSELSGRGIGMNVVRSQIESLKGKITISSLTGKGTTFTMHLPLTLTIAKLLVCSLGITAFAIPSDSIEEIIIPLEEQIKSSGNQKFLYWNQQLMPIYSLKELLLYNCTIPPNINSKVFETIATPQDWLLPLLLLRRGQRWFALEVEQLIREQELVIKPLSSAIATPSYIYGCTILSDGTLVPAFDGTALINEIIGEEVHKNTALNSSEVNLTELEQVETETEQKPEAEEGLIGSSKSQSKTVKLKTIMVVDDSTALRRTMALSLEKNGYRVLQAKDGKDALNKIIQNSELDLIICDIEMPTMNGFEFLGARRRDSQLAKIPVIMLTSRSGAKHRNLAMQLGANGYFTKPYIEQEFLVEIGKILQQKNNLTSQSTLTPQIVTQKTIMVIDDSSALRRTMALSLSNKGYRVLQARDGKEGLELLKNNLQTNLVICDIEMPNMNGFEFLTSRQQNMQLTKIPVAMLTFRSSDKQRNLAISLGADAYFTKPYVEEQFILEIEKIIQNTLDNK